MKEHPIIFSTPMLQALLNTKPDTWPAAPIDSGKPFKSMTRRVIKPQPDKDEPNINYCTIEGFQCAPPGEEIWIDTEEGESVQLKPRYEKGDLLWVRETHGVVITKDIEGEYNVDGYVYKADKEHNKLYTFFVLQGKKWKPSIFMPREAARLFLEVKSVRVERLQDISEKDAQAEGVKKYGICKNPIFSTKNNCSIADCTGCRDYKLSFKAGFMELWDSLNAKRGYSWESNPWVWVYEFMRVER